MAMVRLQNCYDRAHRYMAQGEYDKAEGICHHILQYYSQDLGTFQLLGQIYLERKQASKAREFFRRVLEIDPENVSAHWGMGIAYQDEGKLEQAISEFEQALEIKPDLSDLRNQLLRLYTELYGASRAQLRLSRAGLGRLYVKGEMLDKAVEEFQEVLQVDPGRIDVRLSLLEALWRSGNVEDAARVCTQILESDPNALKANLILGYLRINSGQREEGEQLWRRAAACDPNNAMARAMFEMAPMRISQDFLAYDAATLPDFDEEAWAAHMAEMVLEESPEVVEEEILAPKAPMAAVEEEVATPVEVAETETPLGISWLDELADGEGAIVEEGAEEWIEGVAAFELDRLGGLEEEAPAQVSPFDLGDLEEEAPVQVSRFDLGDLEEEEAPAAPFDLEGLEEEMPAGVAPFDLGDLEEEAPAQVAPFDLEGLEEETPAIPELEAPVSEPAFSAEPSLEEMEPFSLEDLGLSAAEIAGLEEAISAVQEETPTEAEAAAAALEEEDLDLMAGLDLFSLEEEEPAAGKEELPAGVAPFSFEEEELDLMAGLEPFSLEEDALAAEEEELPAGVAPFSFEEEELDLIAGLEPFSPEEEPAPVEEELLAGLDPFSLEDIEAPSAELVTQPGFSLEEEHSQLEEAEDLLAGLELEPFSFEEGAEVRLGEEELIPGLEPFSLEAEEEGGLQPFSLEALGLEEPKGSEFAEVSLDEAIEGFEGEGEAGIPAFSWQEPEMRDEPAYLGDLAPGEEGKVEGGPSIFEKLMASRPEDPTAEQVPEVAVPEEAAEELLQEAFEPFSLEEIGLEEPAAVEEMPLEEVGPFSLEELGLEEPIAAPVGEPEQEPPAAEEDLELEDIAPFFLEELGVAGMPEAPAEVSEQVVLEGVEPFSLEELGLEAPEVEEPLELPAEAGEETLLAEAEVLQPFTLEELGLSPEEIAALDLSEEELAQMGWSPVEAEVTGPEEAAVEAVVEEGSLPVEEVALPQEEPVVAEEEPTVIAQAPPDEISLGELQRQVEAAPTDLELRLQLSRAYAEKDDFEEALAGYKILIKQAPADLEDQLISDLQEWIGQEDEHRRLHRLHRLLGDAYMKKGWYQQAINEYAWVLSKS
ncbi:MAG: tetratricopeptide repeat protein [Chloroflexia bacterium]|nr:tetratricopeptide repeat protein [Chloroflexia bacterium]